MAMIEISLKEFQALERIYYQAPWTGAGDDYVVGHLIDRMIDAFDPTVTLPGPEGEPNVELPLADEEQGDW